MEWTIIPGNILNLTGIGMVLYAIIRHRTDKFQGPTFDYRKWKPIWKVQEQYTPKGFKLQLIGWCVFGVGALLSSIYWLSD